MDVGGAVFFFFFYVILNFVSGFMTSFSKNNKRIAFILFIISMLLAFPFLVLMIFAYGMAGGGRSGDGAALLLIFVPFIVGLVLGFIADCLRHALGRNASQFDDTKLGPSRIQDDAW